MATITERLPRLDLSQSDASSNLSDDSNHMLVDDSPATHAGEHQSDEPPLTAQTAADDRSRHRAADRASRADRNAQRRETSVKDLVRLFKLLSDETRLRILLDLARDRELHVRALCERLGQSQPAVSHHLALLRMANLIEQRRAGKHNYYHLQPERFEQLLAQLFEMVPGDDHPIRFGDWLLERVAKASS